MARASRASWLSRAVLMLWWTLALAGLGVLLAPRAGLRPLAAEPAAGSVARPRLDPTDWGDDHVGQPLPEFVDSGECLFCHRNEVGPTWSKNKHSQTIRDALADSPAVQALAAEPAAKAVASDVQFLLGDSRAIRFLKRAESFGRLDLLSVVARPGRGSRWRLEGSQTAHWDHETFARDCAGCHATAIDPEEVTFATVSLDCYACHGDAPLEHSTDATLMPLARARKDAPRVVTSICAQCHVRFGKSRSTGRAYPNNFVAGDNVFHDFEVDWSVLDNPRLNPADAHVLDNIREVVLYGHDQLTCLSCHEVHPGTAVRHRVLADQKYCEHCHEPGQPKKLHKAYEVHSRRCQY